MYSKTLALLDQLDSEGSSTTSPTSSTSSSDCALDLDYEEKVFHARLITMLQRYLCLATSCLRGEGTGFHAALTEAVFFLTNARVDLMLECFAAPFNSHFFRCCSVFEDTDCWFGSVGSFFDMKFIEGSFCWNAPFCEDMMEMGILQIEKLLKCSNRPLSFYVVLPNWVDPPTPALSLIQSERFQPYVKEEFLQPAGFDQWVDGFHHNNRQRHFTAPWDGTSFFVQNEAGSRKWPVTPHLKNEIVNAFRIRRRGRSLGGSGQGSANQLTALPRS